MGVLADVDNDGDLDAFFFVYVHQSYTLTPAGTT